MNEADVVLDTSAMFALIRDEPGADLVEDMLGRGSAGKITIAASFVSLTEIFYTSIQLADRRRADELIATVKSWPVDFVYPDEALCLIAGEIKSAFSVSFADAFVAATAREGKSILVHKDPEFEALGDVVELKPLPYATRRQRRGLTR